MITAPQPAEQHVTTQGQATVATFSTGHLWFLTG